MSGSITSANATIMMAVDTIYPTAQLLQGYAAEDIFDTDDVELAEIVQGMDGKKSAGYIPHMVKQRFTLMPNSNSYQIFVNTILAQDAVQETYEWNGTIYLRAISSKYSLNNGTLTRGKLIPDAKKTLQPVSYEITWESVIPMPL
ncbi:conserved protein of unknown function [Pararobbsia alpina]|uniref:phage tail fiber protein n=1 Tax=Pararobbsia alpina TaxID=621374 RepID=UPI0039A53C62